MAPDYGQDKILSATCRNCNVEWEVRMSRGHIVGIERKDDALLAWAAELHRLRIEVLDTLRQMPFLMDDKVRDFYNKTFRAIETDRRLEFNRQMTPEQIFNQLEGK